MKKTNMGYLWFRLFLVTVSVSVSCCDSSPPGDLQKQNRAQAETRIVIFHINDVHGEIGNFSRIAAIIKREENESPHVFFMSAGDNFSGNPYVDRYEPRGEPILQLLNQTGCDVQVLGNHEFDYGPRVLAGYISRARFPVICANAIVESGPLPQPEPFAVLATPGGVRIAVLGLLQVSPTTGTPDSNPENVRGIRFTDEIETARGYRYLSEENDIFIALTHLGYEKDKKLARELGELDVIIGGHSHTVIEKPEEVNGVLIAQAGSKNKYLGRIELLLKGGKLVKKSARLIELGKQKATDSRVEKMIEGYLDNPLLNRVIARLGGALENKNEIGNLFTDAIRRTLDLDMAFYNSGGIRRHFLSPTVRLRDIYALEPFNNEIVIFNLFPREIRSLIRYDYENIAPLDVRVSGIRYTVQASRGGRVVSIKLIAPDGLKPEEDRRYTVGMNNYMAASYGFDPQDPGYSSHRKMVDILIDYLQKGKRILRFVKERRAFEEIVRVGD